MAKRKPITATCYIMRNDEKMEINQLSAKEQALLAYKLNKTAMESAGYMEMDLNSKAV